MILLPTAKSHRKPGERNFRLSYSFISSVYGFIVWFHISPGLALVFADVGVAYTTGLGTLYPLAQNPYGPQAKGLHTLISRCHPLKARRGRKGKDESGWLF